ncbi:MAG TPA: DUF2225 domain-containing protein [Candidatus Acetatifactor stercoripullorum]|uniref:DUF2225 domain-containing protein n=1 Tax=Candidatus Acetatifactor stercoripullorum TaxID=2838414 RepID=A0A9D1UBV0_9FIRM|nr:DUF2225 domain-containing protein [Candidatus Acetatifactor stercoripullorum]HIW82124.1 DUF2225 domain-containing protein [Candidatus Acetatifactor stercoripullorum]
MAGLLSGLSGLGLGNLENMDIYKNEEKEKQKKEAAVQKVEEKDLIYDKTFECPVCGESFSSKIMKSGKARLLKTDQDLRPQYDGIDAAKYDVELCPHCGYAALSRYFTTVGSAQAKLIREHISQRVQLHPHTGDTYSYEEAVDRYKLALANAVVKRAKASEKAYICLKSAWLLRGYAESLEKEEEADRKKLAELRAQEAEYLENAYNGFTEAMQTEDFPMCGMDEITVEYLIGVLAARFKKYDVASKMVAAILTSPTANNRTKDKARELKEQILADLKRQ